MRDTLQSSGKEMGQLEVPESYWLCDSFNNSKMKATSVLYIQAAECSWDGPTQLT